MKLIGPFTQILTMDKLPVSGHIEDNELEVITNGGILVENGAINGLGTFNDLKIFATEIDDIPYPAVVFPGFVDAHTHICWAGSRASDYAMRVAGATYQEIAKQGGGILDTVRKTRTASKEDLIEGLINRTKRLLSEGVTTCEVKSGYGLTVKDEIKMLEAIHEVESGIDLIPTCLAAHTKPWEFDSTQEYLNLIINELFPILIEKKLANRIDIFVEEGAFPVDKARKYLLKAKKAGFDICLHADQFTRGGALLAGEVRAVSADHLEQSSEEDFTTLKKNGVIPIVLPGASLGLGMEMPPAKKLLDHDLPLVIASDWNPGSAPMGCLLRQAAILGAFEKLTTAETFAGITTRATQALGLNDRGSLKKGQRADLVVFRCDHYQEILYNQGSLLPQEIFVRGVKQ